MKQQELDEISESFLEAWTEFFGCLMYYIPFDYTNTTKNNIYNESKNKRYNSTKRVPFHGTFKEAQEMNISQPTGGENLKYFEITFITKELIDQDVNRIDTNAIIQVEDRFGEISDYVIYDDFQKVQLVDNKIFTKLKVRTR